MPKRIHRAINLLTDAKMLIVMDTMKIRMRYVADIQNHTYFFEMPDYETELGRKFVTKLK